MGQTIGYALNVTEYVFPAVPPSYDETHELLVHFPSGAEADVPAMLLPPSTYQDWSGPSTATGSQVSVCIIYFHANACDIGDSLADMAVFRDDAFDGDAVVLAPEYSGYGLFSEYEPSVESIDLVARAAWRYCRKSLGFRKEQIVVFGRSIGSGPAAALAQCRAARGLEKSASATRPLGAVVLLAPFTSIPDVILSHSNSLVASLVGPMWEVAELLQDPGLRDVPICVVHPREDEVIPLALGQAVLEKAAAFPGLKYGLWITGATHNFAFRAEHAAAVGSFLLEHMEQGGGLDEYMVESVSSEFVTPTGTPFVPATKGGLVDAGHRSSCASLIPSSDSTLGPARGEEEIVLL